MMEADLGFTPEWYRAGIATLESVAAFAAYADKEPDKTPRYWRWMAFRDFAEERTPLNERECRALFRLGEFESDANLGTAMMCCVLYQKKCPIELFEAAITSPRAPLRLTARLIRGA